MAARKSDQIPVIDLFAGPGGLGEGFAVTDRQRGRPAFQIQLSIEKDDFAHQTLELRSFFRQFERSNTPSAYYQHLRGEITRDNLFKLHPDEGLAAREESWHAELGVLDEGALDRRIHRAIGGRRDWVLIGGPPCQAYSMAGRSRNRGVAGYEASKDHRHFLYREYLRIIAKHWPAVFVMENVKGILSSKVDGSGIFSKILEDLHDPAEAFAGKKLSGKRFGYLIYSLSIDTEHDVFGFPDFAVKPASQFLIQSENYGIPQARHRVILLGVRSDIGVRPGILSQTGYKITAGDVLQGLPRVRSGLTDVEDSGQEWRRVIRSVMQEKWLKDVSDMSGRDVADKIRRIAESPVVPRAGRGAEFIPSSPEVKIQNGWYHDRKLKGTCNHTTRAHIRKDLHRYLFAACYADVHRLSPKLNMFPKALYPEHKNVSKALGWGNFNDRFRVQLRHEPSTTVVSHIAKDGHYYIHWDATQCRSMTVREAARLQTFPDNYLFCGSRTEQYRQVGNAVPPLLAVQIAKIVRDLIDHC